MALVEGKRWIWIYHQSQRGFVDVPPQTFLQRHAQIKRERDLDVEWRSSRLLEFHIVRHPK